MFCHECGGTCQKVSGEYQYNDPRVGTITVRGANYYRCDQNGHVLLTPELAEALDQARENRLAELLGNFPISDFLSSKETSVRLGITRQALHKNKRIQKGFIYSTRVNGITLFLEQSVRLYKETGDGRFPMVGYSSKYNETRGKPSQIFTIEYTQKVLTTRQPLFFNRQARVEENCYVN